MSNAELASRLDSGFARIDQKIDSIHDRFLDIDRRVGDHDVRLARKAVMLEGLQRDIKRREGGDHGDKKAAVQKEAQPITRWDLTVFAAAVYLLLELLPKLSKLSGGGQ